jgi:hypothetical protein
LEIGPSFFYRISAMVVRGLVNCVSKMGRFW